MAEAGVPYNVSIAAVNGAGPGEFNVSIYFTSELCECLYRHVTSVNISHFIILTAPNIAPQNLSINRISSTVMMVSWTPLSYVEARGFISHYTVAYSPQTSDGRKRQATGQTIDVPGMDSSTTRIEGLVPDTVYTVKVSATTGGGTSTIGVGTAMKIPTSDVAGVVAVIIVVMVLLAMLTLALIFTIVK